MAIVDDCIVCSTCRERKSVNLFSPSVVKKGCGECRDCSKTRRKEWAKKNPDKVAEYRKTWERKNPEKKREIWRKAHHKNKDERNAKSKSRYHARKADVWAKEIESKYGITADEYSARLENQGGGCACCGAKQNASGKRLFVDHCHETGRIRGILCHNCNAGIGALGDNVEGLERAIEYLKGQTSWQTNSAGEESSS